MPNFKWALLIRNWKFEIGNLIFYLIILLLPTQFGKHFWPSSSFVAGLRVDYLSPTLYLTDILLGLLFVSWIFTNKKFLIFNFKFSINRHFLKNKFTPFLLIALSLLIVGIMFSKNPLAGWYELLKLFEMVFLGWYIATHMSYKQYKTLAFLFCLPLLFESILAIAQFFKQSSIGGLFYFFGERTFTGQTHGIANAILNGTLVLRPYGTFSHPNVLAGYLLVGMIFVSSIRYRVSRMKRIFIWVTIILSAAALLLTLSRVTIILGMLTIIVIFVQRAQSFTRKKAHVYLYMILTTYFLLLFFSPLSSRFSSLSLFDESIVQREFLITQATTMIVSHPIFGVGLHNFLNALLPSSFYSTTFYLQPVHNIFFLIAAETGLLGLGLFIWFLYKTYRYVWQQTRFKFLKLMLLLLVLILGSFDHYFLTLQQGQLLFAFVLGICWAKEKHR